MGTVGLHENDANLFPLSSAEWERAKAILTLAADLPVAERTQFVETHLSKETTLTTSVLSALEAYDRTRTLEATPPVEPQELIHPGDQYGKYRIIGPLGSGGMGQVFLAEDSQIGRRVALKTLGGRWLESPSARRQLLTEARAVGQLEHQNIVRLYEFFEHERGFMLVMEYAQGRTGSVLVSEGHIPLGLAVRIGIQICDAVVYAHDHGILHCDLKPSNIQVTPDGTAKVLDFGLAQAKYDWQKFDPDAEPQGPLIGTPAYMAPERLRASPPKETSDIYSLGVTLFELVTGRRPFEEQHLAALAGAILETPAPRASSISADCPPMLDEILDRALAKDPNQRYQTARELSRDLQEVLKVLDVDTSAPSSDTAARKRFSRLQWGALVLLSLVVSVTIFGFLASTFYNSPLDISMDSEGESPIWWPYWGVRALFLPVGQIGFAIVICGLSIQIWKAAIQTISPLRRGYEHLSKRSSRIIDRVRGLQTPTVAGILLVAQAVTLRLVWARFGEIFEAITNYFLRSGSLAALGPAYADDRQWYTRIFSLVVLAFVWSWYRLLKSHWHTRKPVGAINLAGGGVLLLLAVFATVAPFRLFTKSKAEQVLYQSNLCYLVGERGTDNALFCPLQEPRNRVVNKTNPDLMKTGKKESIFSASSEREPKSQKSP